MVKLSFLILNKRMNTLETVGVVGAVAVGGFLLYEYFTFDGLFKRGSELAANATEKGKDVKFDCGTLGSAVALGWCLKRQKEVICGPENKTTASCHRRMYADNRRVMDQWVKRYPQLDDRPDFYKRWRSS